ncbi:MAG: HprK-related kinase B [Candidatus Nitronauta litoralis]|uniref:HprK-related kinase B n=1 Tax=Candidatus Nitronauta litoralis TaxID=2705533 RepID=A0A7T0G1V3_9BACT|nr:MAG: HprK-related kinase B [Candidatus Nitronauta litoralis]
MEIAEIYKNMHNFPHELNLKFGDCRIRVKTNSEPLCDHLIRYFQDFQADELSTPDIEITAVETEIQGFNVDFETRQPEPGKRKIKEEYFDFIDGRIVRKRLTGMCFIFGKELNLAVGPCFKNDNQVINFINNRFIEWMLKKEMLLAHCAGVSKNGKGIAMAGFSGMGKSTLALHLMSRGFNFISNDRLLLEQKDGRINMWGVPKLPRINPGTALNNPDLQTILSPSEKSKVEKMDPNKLWHLEQKYDVYIDQCYGSNRFELHAPINLIVILNWDHEYKDPVFNRVDLWSRRDLLPALMKSPGLFFLPDSGKKSDFSEDAYLKCLRGCPVLEITGGVDFNRAVDTCIEQLIGL